jgi:hypothetical protein
VVRVPITSRRSRSHPFVNTTPLKRWSARPVHRAQAADQRFRVRADVEDRGFSGLFLGTYSALPDAAPCMRAQRVRLRRCGFAVELSVEMAVHSAAQGMPHAGALLNVSRPSVDDNAMKHTFPICELGRSPSNSWRTVASFGESRQRHSGGGPTGALIVRSTRAARYDLSSPPIANNVRM